MLEWRRSHRQDGGLIAGAQARIDRAWMWRSRKESESAEQGAVAFWPPSGRPRRSSGCSARSGASSTAFEQIAISQNTNLAVVAPGIAEALLATGIGLVAAIPAVVFYNKLNADSERIIGGYEAFADEFATILSRQLDA